MNATQSNKLASYIAVEALLKTSPVVETVPGLTAKVTALSSRIAELHQLGETQTQTIDGKKARRDELLGQMVETSLHIAGVVVTVANEQGLTDLAASVRVNPSDFARVRRTQRPWAAQRVLDAARSVLPQLAPYGVTGETLDAFEAQIRTALEWLHQPRSIIAEKQAATRQLPAILKEADSLLRDSIDRLVLPLRSTNPGFFEAYRVARKIIDRRGSRVAGSPAADAAVTPTEPTVQNDGAVSVEEKAAA